jgi:hypothetical protein
MEAALGWLETTVGWTTGAILCDNHALVGALGSGITLDPDILSLQRRIALLGGDKSLTVAWIPGHCAIRGNERADELAKAGSSEPQQDVLLDHAAELHLLRRSCCPPPIAHPRLASLYEKHPDLRREDASLSQKDSVDLVRFRSGHHPALRRWQHLTGAVDSPACRFCGDEEESSIHLWLSCPAFDASRLRLHAGQDHSELINPTASAKALLRTILRRLR